MCLCVLQQDTCNLLLLLLLRLCGLWAAAGSRCRHSSAPLTLPASRLVTAGAAAMQWRQQLLPLGPHSQILHGAARLRLHLMLASKLTCVLGCRLARRACCAVQQRHHQRAPVHSSGGQRHRYWGCTASSHPGRLSGGAPCGSGLPGWAQPGRRERRGRSGGRGGRRGSAAF